MPERALVHDPTACAGGDRGMAPGLQRAAAEEAVGRVATGGLRRTHGSSIKGRGL